MRRLFLHTFTTLRLFLYWYHGLVLVLILAPLLIQFYLNTYTSYDVWLDDPFHYPHSLGWIKVEFVILWGLPLVLFAMSDKRVLAERIRVRTPHGALPLTLRSRALGEALGITIVCLACGLAVTVLETAFWNVPLWAACGGFVLTWTLWIPLVTAAALHLHEGRADTALLLVVALVAAEAGAAWLGLLGTPLGTLAVSAALLAAVLLLGDRPRIQIVRWGAEGRPRKRAEPRGGEAKEAIHRPARDPVVQLRHDTWQETRLMLKICLQIGVAACLVILAFFLLEWQWGTGGWILLAAVGLAVFKFNLRSYRGGIPGDTVGPSQGHTLMGGYLRAWATLPVPTHALARALFRQAAVLTGFVLGVHLLLAGVAALRGNAVGAMAVIAFPLAITLGAAASIGVLIAFATGSVRERVGAALGLGWTIFVYLELLTDLAEMSPGLVVQSGLAIPGFVLAGVLPIARVMRSPSPEVPDGES